MNKLIYLFVVCFFVSLNSFAAGVSAANPQTKAVFVGSLVALSGGAGGGAANPQDLRAKQNLTFTQRLALRILQNKAAKTEAKKAKLEQELATAVAENNTKKVQKIKDKLKTAGDIDFKGWGIKLLIGGLLAVVLGYVLLFATGLLFGALFIYLGWLVATVGGVFLLIWLVNNSK